MAKSPGHLRALRRSRAMAAVPLTFRWTSADPRSQSCRIGGEGGLAVKKWGNHETLRKTTVFTMENHETLRKTTVFTMENHETLRKTTVFTMENHETLRKTTVFTMQNHETLGKTTVFTMQNHETLGKTTVFPWKNLKHGKKPWFWPWKIWKMLGKLMGKKDERIGKSAENLWKTMRNGRFIMQIFHLLEQKKGWIVGSTEEITNTMIRMGMGWF